MRYVTCETCQATCDTLKMRGEPSLRISAHHLLWFGSESVLKIFVQKITASLNHLFIVKVLVEQPRLHWSVIYRVNEVIHLIYLMYTI